MIPLNGNKIDSISYPINELKMVYLAQASLNGSGEGGSARINDMVNLFLNIGIKINLVSYSFYSSEFKVEYIESSPQLRQIIIHIPKDLPKFIKGLSIFPFFLYSFIYSLKCDIIFSDFISVLNSVPAVILKYILRKPLMLDYIDVSTVNIIDALHKLNYVRNSDIVFAISPYLRNMAMERYGCKEVIYLPIFIDIDIFQKDLCNREIVRGQLGITSNEIVIGYAGSFWNVEGLPVLLKAFSNLIDKHKNLKLAIIGNYDGNPHLDNVPQLIKDMVLDNYVIQIPRQGREDIPKYLSAFDILCCPKIDCEVNRAANPVKVVEYLSMSLPTVASAVGGISDAIDNGINGILVKPGDVKDLEDNLEWIILNPSKAKEISLNGRKKVIEKYSHESVKSLIRKTIASMVNKG